MKQFIKVFLLSLIIFSIVITTGIITYAKYLSPEEIGEEINNENPLTGIDDNDEEFNSPLERAMHKSKRINVLLVGLEGTRTDTIMLASYDRKAKEADIISIPRDTYYLRDGYGRYSEMQKINAVFGSEELSYHALMDAIEDLTGLPIDKYVSVDYAGVRAAVDAIGGVNFNIPFHMRYTDIYDSPPLYINIAPGEQIIDGDKALQLLRFRTGDPGYPSYQDGDLGRVKTQQEFIKAAVRKSLSLKLPNVISAVYPHVKTNFTLTELLGLGTDLIGFKAENLTTHMLPGVAQYLGELSFYIPNGEEMTKLMYDLYDVPLKANLEEENLAHISE
ncbi:MAG: LCP family protein [Tissierellia bacterium]|nr:LCP family protein [Tissierellia bacterium]